MDLKLKALNKEDFKAFGEIISVEETPFITINEGFAQKHNNLVTLDSNEKNGKSTLHIYVAKNRIFPLKIHMLEKHPYFSQTFMPRSSNPFICVVALGDEKPDLSTIKAFITNGNQGVHYKRGIWHFPLISIEDQEQFIVLDRTDCKKEENKLEDCIEFYFDKENINLVKD